MSLLLKFSGLLIMVSTVGVLHSAASQYFTQPDIAGEQMHQQQQSSLKNNHLSDDRHIPQIVYVDDINDVAQGSLFYTAEQAQKNTHIDERVNAPAQHSRRYQLSPTLGTEVKIHVTGMIARTQVTQRFHNPSQDWVNGIYAFPLPENAAVDHLSMVIGERVISGKIMPKAQAKAQFDNAKMHGRKASLITQHRPNLFTNAIANIGPQESLSITIEYQQVIAFDEQTFALRFPMTITPRYSPTNTIVAEVNHDGWASSTAILSAQTNPVDQPANPVSISVELDSGFALNAEDIVSEHHKIIVTPKHPAQNGEANKRFHIALNNKQPANRDFSLTWRPATSDLPSAAHFTETQGEYRYGLVMLTPPIQNSVNERHVPREVIFLLDTSGSMAGDLSCKPNKPLALH